MTASSELVDVFVDAGLACARTGTARAAAGSLADRLIAEGHGEALAEMVAAFWSANDARLALRDRWNAHRAALDPGQKEPPPPPPPPTEDPAPAEPPSDRGGVQ